MIPNKQCLLSMRRASNRNTPPTWVLFAGVGILFSWETAVAFYHDTKRFRMEKRFSDPIAERHMHETGTYKYTPLDETTFVSELNSTIAKAVLNSVTHQLGA